MQKLFLFDFDGVIVDSLAYYERRIKLCLEKIGTPVVQNRSDFISLLEGNFYEALAGKGVDIDAFKRASADVPTQDDAAPLPMFDSMAPVLAALHQDHVLVIISSNVSSVIRDVLSRHRIIDCFEDILGADFCYSKYKKIIHAIDRFRIEKDRTFFIGDTTGDIKEATRAGVATVAVTWGWHPGEMLEKENPDYLIPFHAPRAYGRILSSV